MFSKDPDLQLDYNMNPDINNFWSCVDLSTSKECHDSNDKELMLNVTDYSQTFKAKMLTPYSTY
jgi:hypothetical protein